MPALVLAVLLALVGCTDDAARGPAGTAVPPPPAAGQGATGAAATTTQAAELRAGLTWLLVERSQLLAEGRAAAADDPAGTRLRAVRDRLDQLDAETARAVGGRPRPLVRALLAEVDVALAPTLALPALAAAHARTVEVLAGRVPGLATDRLREALDRSTRGLGAAVPRSDPRAAGAAAGLVANAVAAQRRLGSTETSAVVLRSDLTTLLVARTWLAGSPEQAQALDDVTRALAARLAGEELLVPLRAGHAALTAAAQSARDDDPAGADRSRAALASADADLVARLSRAVPALPAELLRRELDPSRGPLLAAVGARGRGDDDAYALSSAAAQRAVVTAAVLAAGLAEHQRLS